MPQRIKRDRVPFICPNCDTRAYSRPSNQLVCGLCFLELKPQIPDHYPKPYEAPKPNTPRVDPLALGLADLALPVAVRDLIDSLSAPVEPAAPEPPLAVVITPEAPTPPPPAAVARQPKAKRQKAKPGELESAAEHCRLWLDRWEHDLQGLGPKDRVQRYLNALADGGDPVFQVNGWNGAVAPAFGVTGEAVRQAKKAWLADQPSPQGPADFAPTPTCGDDQGVAA